MKKLRPIFVFALIVFSPFTKSIAQTFSGPEKVCPGTTARWTFTPASGYNCSVTFGIQGGATIVATTNTYIDFKLPDYNSTTIAFPITASYGCSSSSGGAGTANSITKMVYLSSARFNTAVNKTVPCGGTTTTISYTVNKTEAGEGTWSVVSAEQSGWSLQGTPNRTQQPDGNWVYTSTWNTARYGNSQVRLTIANPTCSTIAASTVDFPITRPSGTLTPVNFNTSKSQLCANTSANFAIDAYPDATSYIWTSVDPTIKINGQTPPLTLPAASGTSVTVSVGTKILEGGVSAVAVTPCGQTPAKYALFFVGSPAIETMSLTNPVGGEWYFCSSHYGNTVDVYPNYGPGQYEARLTTLTGSVVASVPIATLGSGDMFGYQQPGWYVVGVRPKNTTCGAQTWFENEVEYVDCTGNNGGELGRFSVTATPNPTTSTLVVNTTEEKEEVKKLGANIDVQYILFDFFTGQPVRHWSFKNDQTVQTLQVQGLKPGPYVLQVVKGKYKSSKKIIVR